MSYTKVKAAASQLSGRDAIQKASHDLTKAPPEIASMLLRQIGGSSASSIVDFINKQREPLPPSQPPLPSNMAMSSPEFQNPVGAYTAVAELAALRREFRELELYTTRMKYDYDERVSLLEARAQEAEQTSRRLLQRLERLRRGEDENDDRVNHHTDIAASHSTYNPNGNTRNTIQQLKAQHTNEMYAVRHVVEHVEKENAQLKAENKSLKEKLSEAEKVSIRTNLSHAMVELALDGVQNKNTSLQAKLGDIKYQLKDQEIQLEASRQDTARLTQALQSISELRAKNKILEDKIASLQRENEALLSSAKGHDRERETEMFIQNVTQSLSTMSSPRRSISFSSSKTPSMFSQHIAKEIAANVEPSKPASGAFPGARSNERTGASTRAAGSVIAR